MKIDIRNSFLKDLKKIIDPTLKEQVEQAILSVKKAETLSDIPNLKKLRGYRIFYRIKIGDYRTGVMIENNLVTFFVFMHRKDIYKFFP